MVKENIDSLRNKKIHNENLEKNPKFKLNLLKNNITEGRLDKISEKLEDGHIEALKELEQAGISYTTEEKDNGYKVKFEVADTKYTISYIDNSYSKPNLNIKDYNKTHINQQNNYSNELQDLISKSINELQQKVEEMAIPTPPSTNNFETTEDYNNALNDYYIATENYEKNAEFYWDIIADLKTANSISEEQERLEQFDSKVKKLVSKVNNKEEVKEILDTAKDFKEKVNEKISCEKDLKECIESIISLKAPNPPIADTMSADEYKKQFEIYTKLQEQYNQEKEMLEKREEMLSRKLQLFETLLNGMFLYEDV